MRYCSVRNCPTKSGDGISMHGFQKDWFSLSEWKNENPLYVCSRHFDTKLFRGQMIIHFSYELYTPHCILHCLCSNVSVGQYIFADDDLFLRSRVVDMSMTSDYILEYERMLYATYTDKEGIQQSYYRTKVPK